jgi:hypothetical protein
MLSVVTTFVCELVSLVAWLIVEHDEGLTPAVLFARYLHFSSIVTAVVSLLLLGAVLKLRMQAPPRPIVAFAVAVALLPILAAFFY